MEMSFTEPGHRELWKGDALVRTNCPPLEPSRLPMAPEKVLLEEARHVVPHLPFASSQEGL